MKDIVAILREQGFEVQEGQEAEIRKALSGNYVTTAEAEKKVARAEAERDQLKEQASSITEQLKALQGKNPEELEKQLKEANDKLEKMQADYDASLAARDKTDAIEKKLAEYKFTSKAAKEAVRGKLMAKDMKLENGTLIGLDDYLKEIQTSDADAFAAQTPPAKFTQPQGSEGSDTWTREKIEAIKDTSERRAMMERHADLFLKAKE